MQASTTWVPYANRARGERAKAARPAAAATTSNTSSEPQSEFAARAKAAWARLIRKIYEADPLECPKGKSPMRVIALIDDPAVIRRLLEHLGCGVPEASGPAPPEPEWPLNAVIPLTYHSVPDIA